MTTTLAWDVLSLFPHSTSSSSNLTQQPTSEMRLAHTPSSVHDTKYTNSSTGSSSLHVSIKTTLSPGVARRVSRHPSGQSDSGPPESLEPGQRQIPSNSQPHRFVHGFCQHNSRHHQNGFCFRCQLSLNKQLNLSTPPSFILFLGVGSLKQYVCNAMGFFAGGCVPFVTL